MPTYIYKGKPKALSTPQKKPDSLCENMSFIFLASKPCALDKKQNPLLCEYKGSKLIDFHLDLCNLVAENCETVFVTGFESKKIVRHQRRNSFIIVENQLFELTNDAEDLKLGINAIRGHQAFIIDCTTICNLTSIKAMLANPERSSLLYRIIEDSIDEGIELSQTGEFRKFCYSGKNKTIGAVYLAPQDLARMKKKVVSSTFCRNKFDFEMLDEINFLPIFDEKTIKTI